MGIFGRLRPGSGAVDRRRAGRLGLTSAALFLVVAAGLFVVVIPSLAVGRHPTAVPARSAPNRGLTKATAIKAKSGRTYKVTLANDSSQRWLVVNDPYDPELGCSGRCPTRNNAAGASALVEATVKSHGGSCVAHVILLGPTEGGFRRLRHGLVVSGTTFTAVAAPSWFGRVYLELTPLSTVRCVNAHYSVHLVVQRARANDLSFVADSASAAQYGPQNTALARKQAICAHKGDTLDRQINALNKQIISYRRSRRLRAQIARLKSEINAAVRKFDGTCPPP